MNRLPGETIKVGDIFIPVNTPKVAEYDEDVIWVRVDNISKCFVSFKEYGQGTTFTQWKSAFLKRMTRRI
jgi:hypothetical protein